MRDNITCEEVFEADADARAEFEGVCDEWETPKIINNSKTNTDNPETCFLNEQETIAHPQRVRTQVHTFFSPPQSPS